MPFKYNALLGLGLDNTIPLDGAGKIPSTFLPSYVDDVEEYNNLAAFPATGETGKIYVAIDTGFVYRWSGSVYVQIGITAAAGSTTQVQFNDAGAFGGDSGLTFDKTTDALSAGGFIPTSSTVPANGIYLPAANSVGVATNGVGRLFVDASGNVGVNNSSPGRKLNVHVANSNANFVQVTNSTTGSDAANGSIFGIGNDEALTIYQQENNYLVLGTNNTERLRIDSAGRVGIGTSAPTERLHLIGSTASPSSGSAYNILRLVSNSGTPANAGGLTIGAYWNNADVNQRTAYIQSSQGLDAGSTARALLLNPSGGNVGIGTTSPSALLDIQGSQPTIKVLGTNLYGAASSLELWGSAGGANYKSAVIQGINYGQLNLQTPSGVGVNSFITLATGATEAARIDSSGRLLIGTSTARANFLNSTSSPNVQIEGAGADGGSLALVTSFNSGNSSTRTSVLQLGRAGSTSLGSNTIVAANNFLGSVIFSGNDGSEFVSAASIDGQVDGTPGANDMPGRLVFSVTADGAASPTEALRISNDRSITVSDGGNVVLGTTTGTKIGTATTQKLGFYNATPVVQPTAVADATDAATALTQFNDLLAKLRTLGIIAT
jgi:hypothetical protein